jgi:hypothetical protein
VKKWRYKPHLVEGLPMEFETEVKLKVQPTPAADPSQSSKTKD